jgi:hypothetical protein
MTIRNLAQQRRSQKNRSLFDTFALRERKNISKNSGARKIGETKREGGFWIIQNPPSLFYNDILLAAFSLFDYQQEFCL